MKVQDVFIYFYYLGREDQVRYTVLSKRIHVSKGLGTVQDQVRYTVLGTRKDRYMTKCTIRYLANGYM